MILEATVISEMKREPPMTIQMNPIIRAASMLILFKIRKGKLFCSYSAIPLKKALIVKIAAAKRKMPGKRRDFLVILLPVKKTNKERNRTTSVKQSWDIQKNTNTS